MNLMPQVFVCWRMRQLVSVQSIWCIQLIHLCIGQCLFSHFKILFEALVDSHSKTDRFYPTIWTFLVLLKVLFLHKFKTLLIFMHTARPVACFSRQALQMHAPMHTNYVIGTGLCLSEFETLGSVVMVSLRNSLLIVTGLLIQWSSLDSITSFSAYFQNTPAIR